MNSFRSRLARRPTGYRLSPTEYAISSVGSCSFPGRQGEDDRRRIDGLRLLQQVPAIVSLSMVDPTGTERVFVSRVSMNRTGRGADMSADPAVVGARANRVWYGPVHYQRDSEPYMRIAVAGNRAAAGVVVADINLKLIWDIIAAIKIGDTGHALIVDDTGRLVAHPDISLVLRSGAGAGDFDRLKSVVSAANGSAVATTGEDGKPVVALSVRAANVGWTVIAEQPVREAFESIRAALWRSLVLIAIGIVFAFVLAYWRACRMWGPIRQLEAGVERIGMGQFDHRITIESGDELEQLAIRFNQMAEELAASQQKSERINRLKQFLAPQVAELVEHSDQRLLDGQRREVVAIFGDLRGFTAFTARAEPDAILAVLRQYYEAVGAVTARHEATLIRFAGDGVMVLVNAPVACENPAHRGIRLAIDMQAAVQSLASAWYADGCALGFRRRHRDGAGDRRHRSVIRDASTTRRSATSSIWRHGFAAWPTTGRSWWIPLSPSMSRTASRLPRSASSRSRATIMRSRSLPSSAAADGAAPRLRVTAC